MIKPTKILSIILLNLIIISTGQATEHYNQDELIKIIPNTFSSSNTRKVKEYLSFFREHNKHPKLLNNNLPEIDADPISVAAYKASMSGEDIIIEDTSLDIEREDVGVNLKHKINEVHFYVDHKAILRVLLAFQHQGSIYVYEGKLAGKIIKAKTKADQSNIDAIFLPEGQKLSLAQNMPNELNVRYLATKNLFMGNPVAIIPVMHSWNGPWQKYP